MKLIVSMQYADIGHGADLFRGVTNWEDHEIVIKDVSIQGFQSLALLLSTVWLSLFAKCALNKAPCCTSSMF